MKETSTVPSSYLWASYTSWHDCKAENEGKKRKVKKVGRTILSLSKYLIIQRKLQELSHPSKPDARERRFLIVDYKSTLVTFFAIFSNKSHIAETFRAIPSMVFLTCSSVLARRRRTRKLKLKLKGKFDIDNCCKKCKELRRFTEVSGKDLK